MELVHHHVFWGGDISEGLKMFSHEFGVFKLWKFKCTYVLSFFLIKLQEKQLISHEYKYKIASFY